MMYMYLTFAHRPVALTGYSGNVSFSITLNERSDLHKKLNVISGLMNHISVYMHTSFHFSYNSFAMFSVALLRY